MTSSQPNQTPIRGAAVFLFSMACFAGAAFLAINGSLHQMTENDCRAGIQAACDELAK
jgi:hypothetical protein|tara:strand:+ start:7747 stop:7920 length:174 start_codon:yes stop_codon:yes gene_type:complete